MEQKFQEILNSLKKTTRKNTEGTFCRWKITKTILVRNHMNQLVEETNPRYDFVKDYLSEFYRIEVQSRYKKLYPIDQNKLDKIVNFMTNESGQCGLLMHGTPGNGKTTWLRAIENTIKQLYYEEIKQKRMKLYSLKASELGKIMKDDKDDYKVIKNSAVLLLDDIGFSGDAEMVNDYGIKTNPIIDIIEHRYDMQLFTVLTTNLNEQQLFNIYGQRVHSRLNEMCVWLDFKEKDFRLQN